MQIHIFPALFLFLLLLCSPGCKDAPLPVPGDTNENQYTVPATQDIILYEVNLRAFSKQGNLAGVLERIDSLKDMGINALWLMPVYPIGQIRSAGQMGSPYSIRDYTAVNPELGNIEDLKLLIKEAHKRNIAIILDWVANHTAWDHPWIKEHKDWYTQDASGNIIIPAGTNWQDVADLNYTKADMRLEMIQCMRFWTDSIGVDGFRCDAADFVPYDFWKQAIDSLQASARRPLILLAEGARADHFKAGFQLNFSWDFYNRLKSVYKNGSANGIAQAHQAEYNGLGTGSHKLRFITNHDEYAWDDSPINIFGGIRASVSAFVLALNAGGVPLIYSGQETGISAKIPFFSRAPINWNLNPNLMEEYKNLILLRRQHQALRKGSTEWLQNADIAGLRRIYENDTVIVLVNTRNRNAICTLPQPWRRGQLRDILQKNSSADSVFTLQPFEYKMLTP